MRMRASRARVAGLHEIATIFATEDAASASACTLAPVVGGSKMTAPNGFSSAGGGGFGERAGLRGVERIWEKVAFPVRYRLQAARPPCGSVERLQELGLAVDGRHRRPLRQAQCEG